MLKGKQIDTNIFFIQYRYKNCSLQFDSTHDPIESWNHSAFFSVKKSINMPLSNKPVDFTEKLFDKNG